MRAPPLIKTLLSMTTIERSSMMIYVNWMSVTVKGLIVMALHTTHHIHSYTAAVAAAA